MGSLSEQYRAQQEASGEERRSKARTFRYVLIGTAAGVGVIVLAFVVVQQLPASGQERYDADLKAIRIAVLAFTTGLHPEPPVPSVASVSQYGRVAAELKDRYPTFAAARTGREAAVEETDVGNGQITTLGVAQSNPTGSKNQSGTPFWEDVDGDGKRVPANEKLFYHDASPEPTVDHWNTMSVMFKDTSYVVDSRDWFVDFDMLVKEGFIKSVPKSASPDNSAGGTGSYSWYVDDDGDVKSLLYSFPTRDWGGYRDIYP